MICFQFDLEIFIWSSNDEWVYSLPAESMNNIDVSSPCVTMVNPPHLLNHLGGLWARHRRGGYVSS
jgi:hypothetical protein